MRKVIHVLFFAIFFISCGSSDDDLIRLNEIQSLGTHNSYRKQTPLLDVIATFEPALAATLEYEHRPLDEQFTYLGIRQIELDIFYDPEGGLYANRAGYLAIGQDPASGIPALEEPGFKVLHIQDIDFESSCLTFVSCLENVKAWSDKNPTHLPIMILVEAKDEVIPDDLGLGFAIPLEIDSEALDAIDADILSVFEEDRIIKPSDVKGVFATLEDAVLAKQWPTLESSKGKVMFALDNGGTIRDRYINNHPSLEGRVMFADAIPGTPEAAFLKLNDPNGENIKMIQEYVAKGYIVRTRADADTIQARTNDTSQREAALASGAQFVSTDYPEPNPDFSDYQVIIPGGSPSRCNPVTAPDHCDSTSLERL